MTDQVADPLIGTSVFPEMSVFTLLLEDHGVHTESDSNIFTAINVAIPRGMCKRRARREFRNLLRGYGVTDINAVFRTQGFTELI